MENKLISIIIPCYNDFKYIEQSVNSALNQTYTNKEVIVIDDGSNLKTKEVLKNIEPQITKLITQENQGQSTARNVGTRAAGGAYILVLDSDDFFEDTFCEKAIELFNADDNVKLVSCYANLLFEDGTSRVFETKGGTIMDFLYVNRALGTSMFRKRDWNIIGGYDEMMNKGFEDWEFFIRLLKHDGVASIIKEPLYNYRKRSHSTTKKANAIKYQILKYIYFKHSDLYKEDYENFVTHLLAIAGKEEDEKIKNLNRIEYRLGHSILRPIRFLKRIFS